MNRAEAVQRSRIALAALETFEGEPQLMIMVTVEDLKAILGPPGSPSLGTVLHDARISRKLSLSALAVLTGYTKAHLHDLERGNSLNPSAKALRAISVALDIPGIELLEAAWRSQG